MAYESAEFMGQAVLAADSITAAPSAASSNNSATVTTATTATVPAATATSPVAPAASQTTTVPAVPVSGTGTHTTVTTPVTTPQQNQSTTTSTQTTTGVTPTTTHQNQTTQTKVIKMQGQSEAHIDLKNPELLSSVDYAILFVIVFSAVISLWRGFTREAFSLLVWLIAMWLAIKYGNIFVDRLDFISEPMVRQGVSYACVFLGALLVGGILNMLVGRLISGAGLSVADRFFGIFFGAARGALFIAVFVLIAGFTPLPKEPWWHSSMLIPHFERAAVWLRAYLPDNIKQLIVFPS